MDGMQQPENQQAALWNGSAGQAWVESQELIDTMFKRLEDLLVEAVPARPGAGVLDVGCGTGSTTLAAARRLPPESHCVGIDISGPMLAAARTRAEREGAPVTFLQADAQTQAFEPASFDLIMSRFGVMFFDDFVQAFTNLRRAARSGGALRFAAWRSPSDNPFMTTAERAAAPLLPNLPPRRPDAPGQFAFAERSRVQRILEESGWSQIEIRPCDVACTLPEPALRAYLTRFGPLGQVLQELDERTRGTVIETVRAAFEPYVHGEEVRFTAACWLVDARA